MDTQAPQVVKIAPDSGRTGVTPREVVFRFDEVVSERPASAASLNALFLISPRDGDPRVDWNRQEIAIRPRRGWKANTAYTITMLPGIGDLRNNIRNTGVVTIFSTGPTIPSGRITGTLFNWADARTLPRALVQARPVSDTTIVYVTSTDSVGNFTLATLGPGGYNVRGISDDNNNRGLDPREPWDSVTVQLADSANVELLAFVRDSIGARIQTVNLDDSVTVRVNFDNPLAVTPPLTPSNFRVRAPDSTDVPVVSVTLPPADTTAGVRRPSRTPPARYLILKLARPLQPRLEYRVRVTDARNLMGVARTSERALVVPVPPPPSPPAAPSPVPPPPPPSR